MRQRYGNYYTPKRRTEGKLSQIHSNYVPMICRMIHDKGLRKNYLMNSVYDNNRPKDSFS